jgi:hypothetical protein
VNLLPPFSPTLKTEAEGSSETFYPSIEPHGVISQKTVSFLAATMRTSNLTRMAHRKQIPSVFYLPEAKTSHLLTIRTPLKGYLKTMIQRESL